MSEFKKAKPGTDEEENIDSGMGEEAEAPQAEEVEKPKRKSKKVAGEASADSEAAPVSEYSETALIGDLLEIRKYNLSEKAKRTREYLAGQSLVKIMIPRLEGEPKDAVQSFGINGFDFNVRKGVYQEVPEDVATMISDNYGQDARLVAEHPLNLKNNAAAAREFSR